MSSPPSTARRPRPPRRWARRAGAASLALALLAGVAVVTLDRWIFIALDPGPFDPQKTPPAPDYAAPASWAALPSTEDGADVALAELPAGDQRAAPADVFYLHPTTALGSRWNSPIDDPAIVRATARGGTLIQASAFNACCAVYAPRYRQANGIAFTRPDDRGARALDVAYADVSAAFEAFQRFNAGRPFILASHSQGTVLAARLLRERIAGKEPRSRLVAAYLVGGPIRADHLGEGVPVCSSPGQTGCAVGWNARAPGYVPNGLEFNAAEADPMAGRLCVSPITWGAAEPPGASLGAVFFDTDRPRLQPGFAAARCEGSALVVTQIGELDRDFMSALLLRTMPGNYHPIEYQLFYADIRRNAADRVNAYLGR